MMGAGVEVVSEQNLVGVACSDLEAWDVGACGGRGGGGGFSGSIFAVLCASRCCCCCCCWQAPALMALSLVFSGSGAVGMCCWQGALSAVWRMTLVSMALQGCGRHEWEEQFSAMGGRTGGWRPGPRCCEDTETPEPAWSVNVSAKLGLWGGVIHWTEKKEELDLVALAELLCFYWNRVCKKPQEENRNVTLGSRNGSYKLMFMSISV